MSWGGAFGANVILKNNKRKHKNKLERYTKFTGSNYKTKVTDKHISKEELAQRVAKYKEEQKATRKKQLIAFGIILGIIICVLIYTLFFLKTTKDYCLSC